MLTNPVSTNEIVADPGLHRPWLRRNRCALILPLLAALAACGEQEDWSPLDGPWDPDHPAAAEILAPPEPDDPVDPEMAAAGGRWYRARGCLACHALDGEDVVGPVLSGITRRTEYEWFRAMVMSPDSMLRTDPRARELLHSYRIPMPDQGVNELHTRAMWEYLRALDGGRP